MNTNKQLVLNMFASFASYVISIGINLVTSPYIVQSIGVEANGFVGLANNFISYASLITIALNSLAGRFVTISIYKNDIDGANRYFSSVFIANIFLTLFMAIAAVFLTVYLEFILNIPEDLIFDVKLLFASLLLNCLIGTLGSIFTVATFAANKLYLNYLRQMESNILRMLLVILLFVFFPPRVSYLGVTALIAGIYVFIFNIYYTKKLLPYIHISFKYFNIKKIWEIVTSGVWNLINRLGQLLLDGLDLLITNIFISATSMGILSVAKTIPSVITGIVGNVVGVFSPDFTILYAQEKYDELLIRLKQSIKIMGIVSCMPIIILIVCGDLFYSLWQPTQDARQLQLLSLITCGGLIFNGSINCIYNIFTVVNKLKLSAVLVCLTGAVSTCITFVLLKTTDLGLIAVAGVSVALSIIRNLTFTAPYGAYCLKQKWYIFYPEIFKNVFLVCICSAAGLFVKNTMSFTGWGGLFILGIICLCISALFSLFIVLNINDRRFLINKFKKVIRR